MLLDIAKEYFEGGAVEGANAILSDIAKETDPGALHGDLYENIAAAAYDLGLYQFAGDMSARITAG